VSNLQVERRELEALMLTRLLILAMLSVGAIGGVVLASARPQADQKASSQHHVAWVAQVLKSMQTIKPGMTRSDLLKVFTTEGGLSTGLHRAFVSRDCPYFKVDVDFNAVGRPNRDVEGRVTLTEGSQDTIMTISRPYLEFSVTN
jgi:hypothetical protein